MQSLALLTIFFHWACCCVSASMNLFVLSVLLEWHCSRLSSLLSEVFCSNRFHAIKKQNKNPKALCGLFKCSRFAKPRVERITTYFFRLIDGSNKQGGSWHLPAAKIVDLFLFAVILPHIHASLKLDRWLYACCFFTSKILCRKCIV